MIAAYRKAALTLRTGAESDAAALAASGRGPDGAPLTVTGTASGHCCELHTCRATTFPDGSQDWCCLVCGRTWDTPPRKESPWWLVLGLVLVLLGVVMLFAAGYVTAIAMRAWGLA